MADVDFNLDAGVSSLDACEEPCSQITHDMSVASEPTELTVPPGGDATSQSSSYSLAEALLDHPGFRKLYKLFSDTVPWW